MNNRGTITENSPRRIKEEITSSSQEGVSVAVHPPWRGFFFLSLCDFWKRLEKSRLYALCAFKMWPVEIIKNMRTRFWMWFWSVFVTWGQGNEKPKHCGAGRGWGCFKFYIAHSLFFAQLLLPARRKHLYQLKEKKKKNSAERNKKESWETLANSWKTNMGCYESSGASPAAPTAVPPPGFDTDSVWQIQRSGARAHQVRIKSVSLRRWVRNY